MTGLKNVIFFIYSISILNMFTHFTPVINIIVF